MDFFDIEATGRVPPPAAPAEAPGKQALIVDFSFPHSSVLCVLLIGRGSWVAWATTGCPASRRLRRGLPALLEGVGSHRRGRWLHALHAIDYCGQQRRLSFLCSILLGFAKSI